MFFCLRLTILDMKLNIRYLHEYFESGVFLQFLQTVKFDIIIYYVYTNYIVKKTSIVINY